MKHTVLLCSGLLLSQAAFASEPASVESRLAQGGINYEVDEDGDYRIVYGWEREGRSQTVYVAGRTNPLGGTEVREVFAPVMRVPGGGFDRAVANRLLRDSQERVVGAWEIAGETLLYVAKLPDDADAEVLGTTIGIVAELADNMEIELTDGEDAF
jgi:hypothetical protein